MEGKGRPPVAAAAISAVLGDDDLFDEILLRAAFPTSLVHAALVCNSWLRLAFLRRFRDLHLLSFYVLIMYTQPRFVPMPQPPELATVVCRASFDLDTLGSDKLYIDRCWNGLLLITSCVHRHDDRWRNTYITRVRCPLHPARYTAILPPVLDNTVHDGFEYHDGETLPNRGSNGLSYFYLAIGSKEQQTIVDVYVLQNGIWAIYASAVSDIPNIDLVVKSLLVDTKIYNVALVNKIYKLVSLDLVSSCLSVVDLPEEVKHHHSFELSLADVSGVHLTHVKGFQLHVWLHRMDSNGVGKWSLVDAVCLCEMCANHMIPTSVFEYSGLRIRGDNSEFVFVEMDDVLYLFDIKCKAVKKVFELTPQDKPLYDVMPFMMVWPPKFPVMKEGCDQKD